MEDDVKIFGRLSFFDSCLDEHLNVDIEQPYKRPLQRKRTKFMKEINVGMRGYEMALS